MRELAKTFVVGLAAAVLVLLVYEFMRIPRLKQQLRDDLDAALAARPVAAPSVTASAVPYVPPPAGSPTAPFKPGGGLPPPQPNEPSRAAVSDPSKGLYGATPTDKDLCVCLPGNSYDSTTGKCTIRHAGQPNCPDPDQTGVMGCDGKRYGNECLAHHAGVKMMAAKGQAEVTSACQCAAGELFLTGRCAEDDPEKPAPPCPPPTGLPFCGCDGVAYTSMCDARHHGIKTGTNGFCIGKGSAGDPTNWPLVDICGADDKPPRLILQQADGTFILQRTDGTYVHSASMCR